MKFLCIIDDNNKLKNKVVNSIKKSSNKYKINIEFVDLSNVDYINKNSFKDKQITVIIACGGDGTIIRSSKLAVKYGIPLVGVNIGHIGFLSSLFSIDDIDFLFEKIYNNDYYILKRSMLKSVIYDNDKKLFEDIALNEFTIRSGTVGVIGKYNLYLSDYDKLFNVYHADGLIISSPTGSTGYSFSAGGPIVSSTVNCIIITPICPHAFNNRSLIIDDKKEIIVEMLTDNQIVKVDGRKDIELKKGNKIYIKKAKEIVSFITFEKNSFYKNLMTRIKIM